VRDRRERQEAAAAAADTAAPPSFPSPLRERARAERVGDRGKGFGISDGGCRPGQKRTGPKSLRRKWEWSTNKETAAQLLAEDSLSIPQIAQQLGTHESTVDRWKKVPEFQARLKENIAAFRTKFFEWGLARKECRIEALTDLYDRLQLIVSERGASAEMKSVAGGATGLLTVTWKQFGAGEERQLIPESRVDTALSAEIRAILKQVAQEVGQWGAKQSQLEIPGTLSVTEILRDHSDRREAATADTVPLALLERAAPQAA